jgi:hypothetical protein
MQPCAGNIQLSRRDYLRSEPVRPPGPRMVSPELSV